ncbi:MAG: arylsulfatase [Planctomycetota bacterium]
MPDLKNAILKLSRCGSLLRSTGVAIVLTSIVLVQVTTAVAHDDLAPPKRDDDQRPNLIFVLSDDVAQGDLGCYGQKLIKTPRLDQMAAEGTRYLQAYCGTSVCAPSRASFFTGLHSGHCPIRGNYEVAPEGQLPLPKDTTTVASVLKSSGYATATFGKWGMGFFDSTGSPLKQGVDHFFGYNCQRHAHSYFPTYLWDDDQPILLPGNNGRNQGETYSQELIQNDMLKWVREHADQPFFVFYAITLPHARNEIDDLGEYADQSWTPKQKAYAAMVTRFDSDMGELMDLLRELEIADNTLIVLSGDNGSSFSPNSEIGKRFDQASNGLRGYKRGLYEGALRQAALAWWPGTVPPGRVDEQPWAFWDLMPTFAELADAKLPSGYQSDGLSLVSYLKGGDAPKRDHFYWELHEQKPIQAARFGNWKAVRGGVEEPIELYDLEKDPGEKQDVAKAFPEKVKQALAIFKAEHQVDPNWPLAGRAEHRIKDSKAAWVEQKRRRETDYVPAQLKK